MAEKWPKNGFLREFSIIFHFWAIFLPFLPLSSLGPFSISISIFFPFRAFGRFPCHTSPAGSQHKTLLEQVGGECRSPSRLDQRLSNDPDQGSEIGFKEFKPEGKDPSKDFFSRSEILLKAKRHHIEVPNCVVTRHSASVLSEVQHCGHLLCTSGILPLGEDLALTGPAQGLRLFLSLLRPPKIKCGVFQFNNDPFGQCLGQTSGLIFRRFAKSQFACQTSILQQQKAPTACTKLGPEC